MYQCTFNQVRISLWNVCDWELERLAHSRTPRVAVEKAIVDLEGPKKRLRDASGQLATGDSG
jgi:hypothetical protein